MQSHNFGDYTLSGIRILRERDADLLLVDAYKQIEGLDYDQTKGVLSGLSREQVQSHNFGDYTLSGIRILRERDVDLLLVDAYKQIGLDYDQTKGVLSGLSRDQVEGLGYHQIKGIQAGLSRDQVEGLDYYQIEGIKAGLSHEQVKGLSSNRRCFIWS